ncbi:hypothetical protein FOL46_004529 [Perkinsus olseni]|uniref:NPHP4 Ig-like domain-containing protein n=1 Tax=Perkinsus olseni TaxID=32597 RepID=A0A7J6LYB8_PEROL|nr:hypothetical protein FOL46_004529 [Perkinsus olseni]
MDPKGVEDALRKLFEELAEGHLVSRSIFIKALGDRGSHYHLVGNLFKHDRPETAAPSGGLEDTVDVEEFVSHFMRGTRHPALAGVELLDSPQLLPGKFSYSSARSGSAEPVATLSDGDVIATQFLDDALCGIAPGSSPSINRTYNVTLRTGQGLRKKISYLNATGLVQIYRLTSSQPSILRLLDDTLVLDPRTKGYIRLMILPLSREIRTRVIVSVTPSDMSVPHAIKEDLAFDLTYMAMP